MWHDSRMEDPGPSRMAEVIVYGLFLVTGLWFALSLYKGLI